MECYSCRWISEMHLTINSPIDENEFSVTVCCEPFPGVPLSDNPAHTFAQLMTLRSQLVAEGFTGKKGTRTDVFCRKCMNYKKDDWSFSPLISYVNLSIYPSPCQCLCVYCNIRNCSWYGDKARMELAKVKRAYDQVFKLIKFGQENCLIRPDATYQVSCGEITIHPFKQQIMNLTRGKDARYFTNGFLYDPDIGKELRENPNAKINLSIDAGIPETWHKVKGVNNFDCVTSNLVRYYNDSTCLGQITLKYIILPGLNDTLEDYVSIIEIMKILEVKTLEISRNLVGRYNSSETEKVSVVGAAAYLMAMLRKNGLDFTTSLYWEEELNKATSLMHEILEKNLI